jgi:hypothetical protein
MTACSAECGYARGYCTRLDAALPRRIPQHCLELGRFVLCDEVADNRKLGYAVVEAPASVAGDDGAMLLRLWAV